MEIENLEEFEANSLGLSLLTGWGAVAGVMLFGMTEDKVAQILWIKSRATVSKLIQKYEMYGDLKD